LVLEDDACMEPHFAATFEHTVLPLLEVPDRWDCLFLGYFQPTAEEAPVTIATPRGPVRLRVITQFFGSHAYILSRRAAAVLRDHAFPLDQQSDAIFLTLRDLGLLRVYCLPTPIVTQCMDAVDRMGSRHTHRLATPGGGCGGGHWWVLLLRYALVAGVAVAVAGLYRRRRLGAGPAQSG
jgi:hypothetical protein